MTNYFIPEDIQVMLNKRVMASLLYKADIWDDYNIERPSIYVIHAHPHAEAQTAVEAFIKDRYKDIETSTCTLFVDSEFGNSQINIKKDDAKLVFVPEAEARKVFLFKDRKTFLEELENRVVIIFSSVPLIPDTLAFWNNFADFHISFTPPTEEVMYLAYEKMFTTFDRSDLKIKLTEEDYKFLVECSDSCFLKDIRKFCENVIIEASFADLKEIDIDFIKENMLHKLEINHKYPSITSRQTANEQNRYEGRIEPVYKKLKFSK